MVEWMKSVYQLPICGRPIWPCITGTLHGYRRLSCLEWILWPKGWNVYVFLRKKLDYSMKFNVNGYYVNACHKWVIWLARLWSLNFCYFQRHPWQTTSVKWHGYRRLRWLSLVDTSSITEHHLSNWSHVFSLWYTDLRFQDRIVDVRSITGTIYRRRNNFVN